MQVLADETLRTIARELVETVRRNVTIDWTLRENVRANLRRLVKRVLRKHVCFQTNSGHRNTRLVAGFTEHGDETTFERTPILAATARNPRILTRSAEGTTIRDIRYRDEQVHVASGPSTGRISR